MHWQDTIREVTGCEIVRSCELAGGDISGALKITLSNGRDIVAKRGPLVAAEGRMLLAMEGLDAPVPHVLGTKNDVLVMEHIEQGGRLAGDGWASLADAFAALKKTDQRRYGWHEDYALRHVDVRNGWADNWAEFWRDNRLACHLPHLDATLSRRIERLCTDLGSLLPANPAISFVHGDLWGGNVIVDHLGQAHLIDPCACYGDQEVDGATLTVFDSPPPEFFDALNLAPGWRERQPVYRLWMWLVHVRLFGSGYRSAVDRELETLGF